MRSYKIFGLSIQSLIKVFSPNFIIKSIITIFVGIVLISIYMFFDTINASNYQIKNHNLYYDENITENIDEDISEESNIDHIVIPKKTYALSKVGKDFIKKHETCVLHAYNDPDPKRRSVGWGHQIRPGENLEVITQEKADELFEIDIQWVNDAINRLISKNDNRFIYTQGFIDGLGSLIYNCGERGVTQTTFYARWQNCRYDKNEPGFINYNDLVYTISGVKTSRISAPGHVQRRYDEYLMMLN